HNNTDGFNALPVITDADGLTINGNGATLVRSDAGGTASFRLLYIATGAQLTLDSVTVSNGDSTHFGGGIYNAGTLEISRSTLSGNLAGRGGGIYNADTGTLEIRHSTLSSNIGGDSGGGIHNTGTLEIRNSTFSGNSAFSAGGG